MKTVGIIAEYNPFHKGHAYLIKKTKEITGADAAIIIMSGNFVQRGTPAIIEKHIRAHAALMHGADLVLELPVIFSTGSAEIFAQGAISLLDKSGITDTLCFGSESGDICKLSSIADLLSTETPAFSETLKKHLKAGCSYPLARSRSICEFLPGCEDIIISPNHILGIEYLKALKTRKSTIKPYTAPRIIADYHNKDYEKRFYSATAMRHLLTGSATKDEGMKNFLSQLFILSEDYKTYETQLVPLTEQDFSAVYMEKILSAIQKDTLNTYADITNELANSIKKKFLSHPQITELKDDLKTKNYTYTRICRCMTHILLGITKELTTRALSEELSYIHVLGCSEKGRELLPALSGNLTAVTKLSTWQDKLTRDIDKEIFSLNLYADFIYRIAAMQKAGRILPTEYQYRLLTV